MKLRLIYMTGGIFRSQVTCRAFTLLEMLVSVAIFMLVSVGISGIYINIIRSQRDVFVSQDIQESLRFAAETMSKELRTAQLNMIASDWTEAEGLDPTAGNKHYSQPIATDFDDDIFFKDQDGKLIHYYLENSRLMKKEKLESEGLAITPSDVEITSLKFDIYDTGAANTFPMLTFSIAAQSKVDPTVETVIQTAVSSRDYE